MKAGDVAAAVVLGLIVGCGSTPVPQAEPSRSTAPTLSPSPSPTVAPSPPGLPSLTPSSPPAPSLAPPSSVSTAGQCSAADPKYVVAIEAALDDASHRLQDAFVQREGRIFYLVANVVGAADKRVASSESWVATSPQGVGLASASSTARKELTTGLPDGRQIYDAEPGGEVATGLSDCVVAAARDRNSR